MAQVRHRTALAANQWISARVAGSGPDVLLLHGIPGSAGAWGAVRDELSARHRVIAPDLIGFGDSCRSADIGRLWADAQADAVMALLDELDARRVLVVGHDFGGPVAAHLLGRAPARVSGLVLASSNTFGDTPIPFPLSMVLWPGVGRLWSRLLFSSASLRMMVRMGRGRDAPALKPSIYVGDRAQSQAIRVIFSTALRELRRRYRPITDILSQVELPVRVLWGDRDPFFPVSQAARTARLIKGAEAVILPGAGHFLPEERPLEMAETIAAMWRTIDSARSRSARPEAPRVAHRKLF